MDKAFATIFIFPLSSICDYYLLNIALKISEYCSFAVKGVPGLEKGEIVKVSEVLLKTFPASRRYTTFPKLCATRAMWVPVILFCPRKSASGFHLGWGGEPGYR
jgi:hypothetical protein